LLGASPRPARGDAARAHRGPDRRPALPQGDLAPTAQRRRAEVPGDALDGARARGALPGARDPRRARRRAAGLLPDAAVGLACMARTAWPGPHAVAQLDRGDPQVPPPSVQIVAPLM